MNQFENIVEQIRIGWGYRCGPEPGTGVVVLQHRGNDIEIVHWPDDSPPTTIDEILAVEVPDAATEQLRAELLARLHQWWDTHPGIEVATGVILPIQEAGRNTNASSLAITLLTQSETIDLVSVEDYTVTIPLTNGLIALEVFRAAYDQISQTWDDTHQALLSATTLEALNAVEMPE